MKTDKTSANIWKSLLVGQFTPDLVLFDQMEQKVTLERFQMEVRGLALYLYMVYIIVYIHAFEKLCIGHFWLYFRICVE